MHRENGATGIEVAPLSFGQDMSTQGLLSHFPHLVLCREAQYSAEDSAELVDSFADRLLHGGAAEATEEERLAVLEALRWLPIGAYSQLAFQTAEVRQAVLARFPLSDDELLTVLRRIRQDHLVVQVARGIRVRQIRDGLACIRTATAPLVSVATGLQATVAFDEQATMITAPLAPLLPKTEYLLESVGPWDGLVFERACEVVPHMPQERARMIALGVVYSCLGEPFRPDGTIPDRGDGAKLSRFIAFPKAIQGALWAAAEREAFGLGAESGSALLWQLLADAFVEVVADLKIDFATQQLSDKILVPPPKEGKHWGAWLPPESRNRIRLQSVVLNRVQRLVLRRLLPKSGYQRRGYGAHRYLTARWSALPTSRRRELLRRLRHRLAPMNYRLLRVALRGIPLTRVAEREGLTKSAVSERLHSTVLPGFDRALRSPRDSKS